MTSPPAIGPAGAPAPARLRVLVTRPQPQADEWVAKLAQRGVDAVALPLLAIAAPADSAAVTQAWLLLPSLALVMFVSPNAVQRFFALRPAGQPWPAGLLAGGTGPGTHRALAREGVPETLIRTPGAQDPAYAGPFDSEALWQCLAAEPWAGRQALIVRGEGGREWLADALRQQGAQLHFVEAYRRTAAVLGAKERVTLQAALQSPSAHLWLLSSSEAVGHLGPGVPGAHWAGHQALATHPRIAQAALALGFGRVSLAAPTPDGVALALRCWPDGAGVDASPGAASIQSAAPRP